MTRPIGLASAAALCLGVTAQACASAQEPASAALTSLDSVLHAEFGRAFSAHLADSGRMLALVAESDASEELSSDSSHALGEHIARFANARYTGTPIQAIAVQFWRRRQRGQVQETLTISAGAFLPALLDGRVTPVTLDPRTFDARNLEQFEINGQATVLPGTFRDNQVWLVATSGPWPDKLIMDRATLRPIYELRSGPGEPAEVEYDGAHISGSFDTTFAVAPFAASGLEAILRALPLATGYAARLPLYWVNNRRGYLRQESIYVTGVDTVCRCWSVNTVGGVRPGFRRYEIPLKP